VVRPLLSLAWIAEHAGPPPMSIDALLSAVAVPPSPRAEIDGLLAQKRDTPELGLRPRLVAIDAWALSELERLDPDRLALADKPRQHMREEADRLLRRIIGIED
jgi:predicted nucleotidyltransferase